MNNIDNLKDKLLSCRPQDWSSIPDIDLYMDQVISYMTRQHIGLELDDEETLTSAMINNYIKSGLLPRANGKKYDRTHIAYLTSICLLKQVLTVGETGELMSLQMEQQDVEQFYGNYVKVLDEEYSHVAKSLQDGQSDEDLTQLALRLAVSGYAQTLACKTILQELDARRDAVQKELPEQKEEAHG
jgi:hypothetical protein